MNLDDYDYFLPKKNLALSPAVPRDSSRLFVYNTKTNKIVFDYFYNLDKYLPKKSFLVLNDTKVLPARVQMTRLRQGSGGQGKVIALFLINESTRGNKIRTMVDRKVNIGEFLYFDTSTSLSINYLRVIGQKEHIFELEFNFSREKLFQLLEKYGTMPIPLYLKKTPLKRDELLEKYQTIFAKKKGSSAAPTASLHFTQRVFDRLVKKGIEKYFVTLHVGLGTFAPITDENFKKKKLHQEFYEVDKDTLQLIEVNKSKRKKLVAVGTTVVRTLESAANNFITRESHRFAVPSKVKNFHSPSIIGKTDLFIFPPYDFKMADCLITNFHLPKSSLMMLVEAFLQFKGAKRHLVDLYNIAIRNNLRFYSFGDVMLII
jgi:S-adenosylmethionine:tRNA ribosyltransferase-isomerase